MIKINATRFEDIKKPIVEVIDDHIYLFKKVIEKNPSLILFGKSESIVKIRIVNEMIELIKKQEKVSEEEISSIVFKVIGKYDFEKINEEIQKKIEQINLKSELNLRRRGIEDSLRKEISSSVERAQYIESHESYNKTNNYDEQAWRSAKGFLNNLVDVSEIGKEIYFYIDADSFLKETVKNAADDFKEKMMNFAVEKYIS